ncbi:hypothetical protein COCMIDRAFT_744 [Bipolaris oryzae ATCC 44560]|uniref:Myb-like DNA-binding domain-containing protein n=1 Tax=Bipolaris oryzae ATCC 44560 TaxID=930090 RepID=W7A3I6_COCMI|nr:uncharacterized protein COCMIDRAFT_744 [Bipolaris oryzae ATCC 44560]EUC50591.1 hypothetical protein COCMIDRAFT_744 [Bipolaris oryzae ATCC 44560]
MPSDIENITYLYQVLTHDGPPTIDWDAVSAALDLNKGAVTKRWSRLKSAMEKQQTPSSSSYSFLWLCVKHSTRTNPINWDVIATACNTTTGAASKRYSRMKLAFERGDTVPTSPAKASPTKAKVARKPAIKDEPKDSGNFKASPNAKRKRSALKTTGVLDDGDEDSDVKPKRGKRNMAKKVAVKEEQEGSDVFFSAEEPTEAFTEAAGVKSEEHDELLPADDLCV